MTRIYQPIELIASSTITLDESASHHLARVLRVTVGENITIFNGQGGEYSAVIKAIHKKNVTVDIVEFKSREAESPLDIWLVQGISRGEKMDYTIQKAVELGVNHILPVFTERCNVKLSAERSDKRLQHWQSVVVSACEQSGRNRIPGISSPQSLEKIWSSTKGDYCLVLSPHDGKPTRQLAITSSKRVILLIGPEGGLSDQEMQLAHQHGFVAWNLGPRVLRTETAALAAISALQGCYGDM